MTPRLAATAEELQRWRNAGLTLPVWWRDDDAVEPTPALDRLLAMASRYGAPLHLAVVPGQATPQLADRLSDTNDVFVLTHGWQHRNHAPGDQKKAEFGAHRPVAEMIYEISRGRARLNELFGTRSLPIFTPPWNRIAPDLTGRLHSLGFSALSSFVRRSEKFAADGLLQVNTHLDPIAWKAGGSLVDPDLLDEQTAGQLRSRRDGQSDNEEPYGLLTHHLVHDESIWPFTEELLELLAESDVARWTSPLYELQTNSGRSLGRLPDHD